MSEFVSIEEAAEFLKQRDRFLLLTHCRPDGDTVGCAAGLCAALRRLGKTAYLLKNPELTWVNRPYAQPYEASAGYAPETVVALDIASLSLLPENAQPYSQRVDLVVDHHPSQTGYGRRCCLDSSAAACGEIVYEICRRLLPLDESIALPLYVAIATDCGGFIYANTTARTHTIAAQLMRFDCDWGEVNRRHFRTKSKKRLLLEAALVDSMELYDRDRIVVMQVPISLMERFAATEDDADELSSLGALVAGCDCAVTMRELQPDRWKISLRTGKRVNASLACGKLGGGGHAAAAGCTLQGSAQQVKEQVLAAVQSVAGE